MSYSQTLSDRLDSLQAANGDVLSVTTGGRTYEGTLMPHHDFSDPDVLVLKLKSGYNVGIKVGSEDGVDLVQRPEVPAPKQRDKPVTGNKPRVAIIGTGGTIASFVDYRTGAVHPALSTDALVSQVPELADLADIDSKVLFSIFSENMAPHHWQELALAVANELNKGAEAVLIPHGTDSMGYTAAALAFMLGDIPRPVILVGAQRSSDRPSSDSASNLLAATRFAIEQDVAEVCVLMHDGPSDDSFAVHFGTRVRKMHTSRRDAFQSINVAPLATISPDGVTINHTPRRKSDVKVEARMALEKDVVLLQYFPGMKPWHFERAVSGSHGAVIAGSGLGHVNKEMVEFISKSIYGGTPVVMTSQCLHGATNLGVYDTGRDLLQAGVITVDDMLPETAYVKLMWSLANSDDVATTMRTPIANEMSERREMNV